MADGRESDTAFGAEMLVQHVRAKALYLQYQSRVFQMKDFLRHSRMRSRHVSIFSTKTYPTDRL